MDGREKALFFLRHRGKKSIVYWCCVGKFFPFLHASRVKNSFPSICAPPFFPSQPEGNFLLTSTENFIFILRKIPFWKFSVYPQGRISCTHTHVVDSPVRTHKPERKRNITRNQWHWYLRPFMFLYCCNCCCSSIRYLLFRLGTIFKGRRRQHQRRQPGGGLRVWDKRRGCFSTSHLTHIHQKSDSGELRKCCSKTN